MLSTEHHISGLKRPNVCVHDYRAWILSYTQQLLSSFFLLPQRTCTVWKELLHPVMQSLYNLRRTNSEVRLIGILNHPPVSEQFLPREGLRRKLKMQNYSKYLMIKTYSKWQNDPEYLGWKGSHTSSIDFFLEVQRV